MFKKYKILFLFLVLIILGLIFYFNRIKIKEYFVKEEKIELPGEIKFEEIQNNLAELNLADETESIVNDVESVETQNLASLDDKNNNLEDSTPNSSPEKNISEIISTPNSEFNEGINLAVPFTIQSPDQKWNEPYKEGCEEASILMVQYFLNDDNITVDLALRDIQAMVDWQLENYGGHFDLPVSLTAQMTEEFLDMKAELINLESIKDIKKIVQTGYPLILPTAGRKLGNPNFIGEGPLYHMLVVKGFTVDGLIITNDPGTRKGENYVYDAEILWEAIADWDEESKNPNQNIKVGILLK